MTACASHDLIEQDIRMTTLKTLKAILPAAALVLATGIGLDGHAHAEPSATAAGTLHVTKAPTCGCCGAWVDLARRHGFNVEVTDSVDYAGMKQAAEVPADLWACHTAQVDGYVVEGHVPFAAIDKLLSERPDIAGISVPGMPAGSPGMGYDLDAVYDVIAWGGSAGEGDVFYTAGR